MERSTKIYIFGAILIALIFLAYYLYKSGQNKTITTTAGGQTQTQAGAGGLFGALGDLIGNVHFGQNLNVSGIGH